MKIIYVLLSGMELGEAALEKFASKGAATAQAFNTILPGELGGVVIQVSLLFFALSTILGWCYYGERCWGYLSGENQIVTMGYKVLFILFCIVGATGSGTSGPDKGEKFLVGSSRIRTFASVRLIFKRNSFAF